MEWMENGLSRLFQAALPLIAGAAGRSTNAVAEVREGPFEGIGAVHLCEAVQVPALHFRMHVVRVISILTIGTEFG